MSEEVIFVERGKMPENFTLINGLPDVGLVGVLATSRLISSLNMEEVASVESKMFPPVAVLHDGIPKSPVRVFAAEKLVAIIGEMAIPAVMVRSLADAIVDWAIGKQANLILSIGGMAVQDRQHLDSPKVFAALSAKSLSEKIGDAAEVIGDGYIVGAYALILRKCCEKNLPAITLLAQSFYNYPDPQAAAAALLSVNKILDLNIDVKELLEKGEEIRLKAKDIMRRTQAEMAQMDKSHEYDVPPLYG